MKKDSIINDYYMKCINQKDDINNRISEIHSGKHNDILEKIREKIYEKYENFVESLRMIEKLQSDLNGTPDETLVWKKKIENLKISSHSIQKDIERAISTLRQKNSMKNLLNNSPSYKKDNNLTNLCEEKKSLDHSIRISDEIKSTGMHILNQLEQQETYLERIKGKVYTMFNKIEISNSITQFLIRRGKSDLALFIVLAILTIVIIYYTYYYLRPKIYGNR